jgi:PAS domain S-box-containing protein
MQDIDIIKVLNECAKDDASREKLSALIMKLIESRDKATNNLKLVEAAIRNDYDSILITEMELDNPGPVIVYVNDGFTKMTGYSRDEAIGKTPRILQGPKTDRAVLDKLKYSLINGKSFFGQTINYRKDGSEFVNQWDIHPLVDEKGNITHWVSYQHDITDRKRAELSVINTNAEADELYEDSKRTIVDFAVDGKILTANKSFRELVGYQKEELQTAHIWDVMPGKFGNSLKSQFERLWKDEFANGNTYRMMLKHQSGVPIQVEIQTKKVELDGSVFVRGDIRNLTLRKRVLTTLRKRNSDYTKLFERKVDFNYGLILDDNNKFRFKWISDGFKNVTGYSVNDCLCADGWDKIIHPDDKALVADHILKAFDGVSSTLHYRIVTKDGDTKKVLDYAKPDKQSNGGQILAVVASAIDVTNRKESTV